MFCGFWHVWDAGFFVGVARFLRDFDSRGGTMSEEESEWDEAMDSPGVC